MSEAALKSAKKKALVLQTQLHSPILYANTLTLCWYPHPQRFVMNLVAYPEYQHPWMFYVKG